MGGSPTQQPVQQSSSANILPELQKMQQGEANVQQSAQAQQQSKSPLTFYQGQPWNVPKPTAQGQSSGPLGMLGGMGGGSGGQGGGGIDISTLLKLAQQYQGSGSGGGGLTPSQTSAGWGLSAGEGA